MMAALAHRGPDRQESWADGSLFLGHAALQVSPESAREEQPYRSPRSGVVLTADVRLDDRDVLTRRLGLRLLAEASPSDDVLIARAYERWGRRCVEYLDGAFAFALWDPAERLLFCARDHFGIKPLRYHYAPGRLFACASEIKPLLLHPGVPRRLHEMRLGDHLASLDDGTSTAFERIYRLPPAHTLTVTPDRLRLDRYWQLEPAPAPARSDAATVEAFRDHLFAAVRRRTRTSTRVAAQLSGGLDSSAVTGVAHALHARGEAPPVEAVSVTTDDVPESDERRYIDAVVRDLSLRAHTLRGDRMGPLSDLDAVYDYVDDEPVSGNHHFIWHLCRTAGEQGARVMLDGFDGDTTVSHGLPYFTELAYAGRWETFAEEADAARRNHTGAAHRQATQSVLASGNGLFKLYGLPVLRQHARHGRPITYAAAAWRAWRSHEVSRRLLLRIPRTEAAGRLRTLRGAGAPTTAPPLPTFVDPSFAARTHLAERARELRVTLGTCSSVYGLQWATLTQNHLGRLLELYDAYAAAHQIELRHPFLDKQLVEFCLSMPSRLSFKDGWTRWILRRSLDGLVPDAVRWRSGKANYTPNFAHGLFTLDADALARYTRDLGPIAPYVDTSRVRKMIDCGPAIGDAQMTHLCTIVSMAYWLRRTFGEAYDGLPRAPSSEAA